MIRDIKRIDVTLSGTFGSFTIRNYGENAATILVEPLEPDFYKEAVGADGTMILNKSYKSQNKKVTVRVLRNSQDYINMKKIVSLEESGNATLMSILVNDNNSKEKYFAPQGVLKNCPGYQGGSDPAHDDEYILLMPGAIYTPPTA